MAPRFNLIKAGAFYHPLPGVFILLQDIQTFYELSNVVDYHWLQGFWHQTLSTKGMLKLVAVDIFGTKGMLVLVVVDINMWQLKF